MIDRQARLLRAAFLVGAVTDAAAVIPAYHYPALARWVAA